MHKLNSLCIWSRVTQVTQVALAHANISANAGAASGGPWLFAAVSILTTSRRATRKNERQHSSNSFSCLAGPRVPFRLFQFCLHFSFLSPKERLGRAAYIHIYFPPLEVFTLETSKRGVTPFVTDIQSTTHWTQRLSIWPLWKTSDKNVRCQRETAEERRKE